MSAPKSRFDHLEIVCPISSNETLTNKGIENKYLHSVQNAIANTAPVLAFLRRISNFYRSCEDILVERRKNEKALEMLKADSAQAGVFGSGYGYSDDAAELRVSLSYQQQLEKGVDRSASESAKLYRYLETTLSRLLSERKGSLVNFGVSYAYIDSLLARKFPDRRFVGIDRSEHTQLLNRKCFGEYPNMEFVADDIFTFLARHHFDGGVFFHTRTMCLLPKSFIEKLYAAVAEAGFGCILGVEQIGLSRRTQKAYRFSSDDQPSELFRSSMYIHNYPHLMEAAGFKVVESELVKTDHPHRDYRFVSCLGVRS